jgi:magnesium-transporting ATPase (P-type)
VSTKTGTLTENKMTVTSLLAGDKYCNLQDLQGSPLPEYCHELMEFAILASKRNPFDPMEKALHLIDTVGLSHLNVIPRFRTTAIVEVHMVPIRTHVSRYMTKIENT